MRRGQVSAAPFAAVGSTWTAVGFRVASPNPWVSLWWLVTGGTFDAGPERDPSQCLTRLEALGVPQASPALLQVATLLAVAAVSLHAVVSAWEVATCQPAIAPW